MRSITYETSETQVETVSAFLMMVLEYCTEIGLFQLLEQVVKINMKAVVYSLLHKAQTVIVSLVMGCAHTKAINERLADEKVAAHYLGMARFPDQSQINRYLTRFDAANVAQLGEVHAQVFMQESRARRGDIVKCCGSVGTRQRPSGEHQGPLPVQLRRAAWETPVRHP